MPIPPDTLEDSYRLPKEIFPTHYDVTLKTDLECLNFKGVVKIYLDVKKETSTIVLNVLGLDLHKASIYSKALEKILIPSSQKYDEVQERVTFSLPEILPCDSRAELKLEFSGKLKRKLLGYFHSSWLRDGKTQNYTVTQFEPTSARRAFPCWDEPALKATFTVNLISRSDTTNLSNMPAASEDVYRAKDFEDGSFFQDEVDNGRWKITRFQPTPRMSSYIVAFANGHFDFLEKNIVMPISGKTLPLRVYATPDVLHHAQLALDVKSKVLPLYEELFDIAFPLPKLDTLMAHDFQGAMENWGLIIGGFAYMLVDTEKGDLNMNVAVTSTQAHEVAHMWFGNITTMEWWNYLYLNEGFATLMSDVVMLEWKSSSSFVSKHLNSALNLDARPSSHPIEVDCPDANQINQIFDSLSYSKAASVLRMLMNHIGEAKFLQGVSLYLKTHLYQNTITADLWESISTVAQIDIYNLMNNWVSKIGFPVLTVTEVEKGIIIRQDRFLEVVGVPKRENDTIWNVPLSILSEDADGKVSIDNTAVLSEREKFIPLDTSKRFKLNAETAGVFRVFYLSERLRKIGDEAAKEDSVFSLKDRVGLVQDAMALSKAGMGNLSDTMDLMNTWKNETEYLVWASMSLGIEELMFTWWEYPDIVGGLNAFRKSLFVPLINNLGYEYPGSESADDIQLRTCAINDAAAARDTGVVKELASRFAYFMKTGDDSKIPANLERVIFTVAVKHGDVDEYEAMVKILENPKTQASTRISAILALGASEVLPLLERTFEMIRSNSQDQDIQHYFRGLANNSLTRRALIKFLKDEYDVLYKRFEGNYWFRSLVEFSMKNLSTQRDYDEAKAFFEEKDTSKYNQILAQTFDQVQTKLAFLKRSTDDLSKWLENWRAGGIY